MNSKKICFVLNQYGSLFYLLPIFELLKQKKIKFVIFSNLNLGDKKNFKENINKISIKKISSFEIIVTDAVKANTICKKITNLKNNYVIQFLDSWAYIKERFFYGNKKSFGNEIWTLDNFSAKKIKLVTKGKSKILKMGHPGYEEFLFKNKVIKKRKRKILIVLQNFKELNFNYSQYSTIDYFEKVFSKLDVKYNYFYLLHPGTKKKNYKKVMNIISFKKDSDITKFTHIMGHYSTLIILPFIMKIKTAIIYNDKNKIKGRDDILERFKMRKLKNTKDIYRFCKENPRVIKNKSFKQKAKYKIINRIQELKQINA